MVFDIFANIGAKGKVAELANKILNVIEGSKIGRGREPASLVSDAVYICSKLAGTSCQELGLWLSVASRGFCDLGGGRIASLYQRIKMKKGGQVALVALARKMLTIIWHLLENKEKYIEEDY